MSTTFRILTYVAAFAVIFLIAQTWRVRKTLEWERLLVRFVLAGFVLYSVSIRMFVYQSGKQKAPVWFSFGIDLFFIALCIAMALSARRKE